MTVLTDELRAAVAHQDPYIEESPKLLMKDAKIKKYDHGRI